MKVTVDLPDKKDLFFNNKRVIDLRSDTLTQPDLAMRLAIASAEVGDDCYNEDSSVYLLQSEVKSMFRKEEALFMASGTLSNQVALRSLTNPGDEVITHPFYHINFFESSQTADLARVTLNLCDDDDGFITVNALEKAIHKKPRGGYYAKPTLVWIENPVTSTAGRVYPIDQLREISEFCRSNKIHLHLDGARIFNASASTGISLEEYAELVDSLTICFAKGLGAPFGSALIGSKDFIKRCKKYRKWYGGGFHQIGFMAKAALHGLQANINNFYTDHENAQKLASVIQDVPNIKIYPVETNIVALELSEWNINSQEFCDKCKSEGVLLFPWSHNIARGMTHCNVNESDVLQAGHIIKNILLNVLN